MFEMLDNLDDEYGSQHRYEARVRKFKRRGVSVRRHLFWWIIHNVISHPLIGFFPIKPFFDFHDWTSAKINLR